MTHFPRPSAMCLALFFVAGLCGCDNGNETSMSPNSGSAQSQASGATSNDPSRSRADAQADVRAAWAAYKESALTGKGETAAAHVTSATHDYYEDMRKLALGASRGELNAFTFMKRFGVLSVRLQVPADQLRAMTGRDLFAHSVDKGWIEKDRAANVGIGDVTVTGDHARAVMMNAGKPTQQYLHFLKQDGVWRFDMLRLMTLANAAFDQLLKDSGMTEDEFTRRLLEATTGRKVTDDLWIPPDAG